MCNILLPATKKEPNGDKIPNTNKNTKTQKTNRDYNTSYLERMKR